MVFFPSKLLKLNYFASSIFFIVIVVVPVYRDIIDCWPLFSCAACATSIVYILQLSGSKTKDQLFKRNRWTIMFKKLAQELVLPLSLLFQSSMSTGQHSAEWKTGTVSQI